MSFGVATLRAVVHAGDKTSGDVRSWYMISGDAKSWVCDCSAYIHCHIAQFSKCLRSWHNDWALNQTYKLTNIIIDVFEYHFQLLFLHEQEPAWVSWHLPLTCSLALVGCERYYLPMSYIRCLEVGLTIVENDRDVKIIYDMANFHGLLEVYVAHKLQLTLIDFYLKNLCVDESDEEVTSKLKTHEKTKKDVDSMSLEEIIAWEQEDTQSPCYLRYPYLKPKSSVTEFKGKALLDDFEAVEGEGLGSSSSNFP
ncbi:hypothetical protein Tco_0540051 [Tanacetum coccineum]